MRQTAVQVQEAATPADSVMRTVEDIPGLGIQEIADHVGVSRSTVRHHIHRLARDRLVAIQLQGNHQLHFASSMPATRRRAIALLRIASVRLVVDIVMRLREEGRGRDILFCAPDVAQETGVSRSSVYRSLKALKRAGLAWSAPAGTRGWYTFSPHPELRIAWAIYCKNAARMPRLRAAPVWMLGVELLLGKLALGGWAAS